MGVMVVGWEREREKRGGRKEREGGRERMEIRKERATKLTGTIVTRAFTN